LGRDALVVVGKGVGVHPILHGETNSRRHENRG
jgi:hypothetical protein